MWGRCESATSEAPGIQVSSAFNLNLEHLLYRTPLLGESQTKQILKQMDSQAYISEYNCNRSGNCSVILLYRHHLWTKYDKYVSYELSVILINNCIILD